MEMLSLGSTYRFTPNRPGPAGSGPAGETGVIKDGAIWNLTGATVYLRLHRPDGTVVEILATITNAALGLVEYVGATTDLSAVGQWKRSWRFVQGAIDIIDPPTPIPFVVRESP